MDGTRLEIAESTDLRHYGGSLLSDEERVELESLAGGEDPNAKKFRTQYSAELFSDEGVSADVSGFGY